MLQIVDDLRLRPGTIAGVVEAVKIMSELLSTVGSSCSPEDQLEARAIGSLKGIGYRLVLSFCEQDFAQEVNTHERTSCELGLYAMLSAKASIRASCAALMSNCQSASEYE